MGGPFLTRVLVLKMIINDSKNVSVGLVYLFFRKKSVMAGWFLSHFSVKIRAIVENGTAGFFFSVLKEG